MRMTGSIKKTSAERQMMKSFKSEDSQVVQDANKICGKKQKSLTEFTEQAGDRILDQDTKNMMMSQRLNRGQVSLLRLKNVDFAKCQRQQIQSKDTLLNSQKLHTKSSQHLFFRKTDSTLKVQASMCSNFTANQFNKITLNSPINRSLKQEEFIDYKNHVLDILNCRVKNYDYPTENDLSKRKPLLNFKSKKINTEQSAQVVTIHNQEIIENKKDKVQQMFKELSKEEISIDRIKTEGNTHKPSVDCRNKGDIEFPQKHQQKKKDSQKTNDTAMICQHCGFPQTPMKNRNFQIDLLEKQKASIRKQYKIELKKQLSSLKKDLKEIKLSIEDLLIKQKIKTNCYTTLLADSLFNISLQPQNHKSLSLLLHRENLIAANKQIVSNHSTSKEKLIKQYRKSKLRTNSKESKEFEEMGGRIVYYFRQWVDSQNNKANQEKYLQGKSKKQNLCGHRKKLMGLNSLSEVCLVVSQKNNIGKIVKQKPFRVQNEANPQDQKQQCSKHLQKYQSLQSSILASQKSLKSEQTSKRTKIEKQSQLNDSFQVIKSRLQQMKQLTALNQDPITNKKH